MRSRRFRFPVAAAAVGVVLAVACAAGSPLVLKAALGWVHLDWKQLADAGQAYGAVSAIFSALAVMGVAGSLIYQGQQLRITRLYQTRAIQREMHMKMLDDPDFAAMAGLEVPGDPHATRRRVLANAYFQYLHLAYEGGSGANPVAFAEDALVPLFNTAAARSYWATAGPHWRRGSPRSRRSFAALADVYYREAVAKSPGAEKTPGPDSRPRVARDAIVVSAIAAVATTGWLIGRRHRNNLRRS